MSVMEPVVAQALIVNQLIDALPRRERRNVLKSGELVELIFEDILYYPERKIEHVYFPSTGFISLIATIDSTKTLEVGLIGNEGMLGVQVLLGVNDSPITALVQGEGTALRIRVESFRRLLKNNPKLQLSLQHYIYVMLAQLTQSTLCNSYHLLESRCARWILMSHDRAHNNQFYLKHVFLAAMLGVNRSGVTIAAGALKDQGLIGYSRGHITILDRQGLEAASCACYRTMNTIYAQLLA